VSWISYATVAGEGVMSWAVVTPGRSRWYVQVGAGVAGAIGGSICTYVGAGFVVTSRWTVLPFLAGELYLILRLIVRDGAQPQQMTDVERAPLAATPSQNHQDAFAPRRGSFRR